MVFQLLKSNPGDIFLKDLIKNSDIFIENFLPNKLAKFNLSYDDLKIINEKIIYASLTGNFVFILARIWTDWSI